jgi:UDPglucose 6-dehydrogenase
LSNIAIVGAGHVGVVYAAGLAELGHRVRVIDVNAKRVAMLRDGRIWFYEPGLPELLARGLARKRIAFGTTYASALDRARFVFVCVPTPTTAEGSLDDSYLRSAFASIREHTRAPRPIIVNKSTVPVGTGDVVTRLFEGDDIHVVSNPEFLAEGRAVEDFFHPSRVVVGARSRIAGEAVAALYAPLRASIVHTDPVTAELSKLAANVSPSVRMGRGWPRPSRSTRASARGTCGRALASVARACRRTWPRSNSSRAASRIRPRCSRQSAR